MARPVNADASATRRRILGSAAASFADRGLDGASIRDIARGAGVSLGMVHHYFGNKDALYDACIEAMYAELAEIRADFERRLEASPEGATEIAPLVEEAVRTSFRFARRHQTTMRLLVRSVVERGQLDEHRQRTVQEPFLDAMTTALGRRLERSPESLRLPVQSITFLIARYAVSSNDELRLLAGKRRPEASVEDHVVDVAHSMLGLPPRRPVSTSAPS